MNSVDIQWWKTLVQVADEGKQVESRNGMTLELIGYQSHYDMNEPLVANPQRKISKKFAFAEASWILSGSAHLRDIQKWNKKYGDYSDDGRLMSGAYGPMVMLQLPYVIDCLKKDPESRQAVMTIWRQSPMPSKDIPCTISLHWIIRDGAICCLDYMRSSDTWLGLPYDIFTFSCITNYLRCALFFDTGIHYDLGSLIHNCGSQHLYEEHYEKAILLDKPFTPKTNKLEKLVSMPPDSFLNWLVERRQYYATSVT